MGNEFPVVCINLERSKSRRARTEAEWRPLLGDRLEYFKAIDGRTAGLTMKRLLGGGDAANAAACLASHLGVMEMMLERGVGEEGVAILEDDVSPTERGSEIFNVVADARVYHPKLDILLLHTPFGRRLWSISGRGGIRYPSRKINIGCTGTQLIWYSERGMRDYIKSFSNFMQTADAFGNAYPCNNGRLGNVVDPVGEHLGFEDTEIGYGRDQ